MAGPDTTRLRQLSRSMPRDLDVDDLLWLLRQRYSPPTSPPCRICGTPLSMDAIGGGRPTRWRCTGTGADGRPKPGRTAGDDHYIASLFEDIQQGSGDAAVMELIARFEVVSGVGQ